MALFLACAACAGGPRLPREQAAPAFDPAIFFAGRTRGVGRLTTLIGSHQDTLVEGRGLVEADGTIVLDQTVRRGSKPPAARQWRLRPAGPGTYVGTLTDAAGAVQGQVRGNRLHLTYPMKGRFVAEQWIDLQPGGRVAHNLMAVRKLGITVARLDETITHLDLP